MSDTAVAAPNSYTYRVCAINGGGSACSNTSGITLSGFPVAPSVVANIATNLKKNRATVTVTWTDNATNETGFRIRRATNAAFTLNLTTATVGANVTTFSQR